MNIDKINQRYKKVSYLHKPEDLTTGEWQYALRKQFVLTHYFKVKKLDKNPVYGDYSVFNPDTKKSYKVALRSKDNSANFCECGDFKTNRLGTCKHIEAVFYYIENTKGKSHLLDKPYIIPYSSVYLDYRQGRKVRIRIGSDNSDDFKIWSARYFDNKSILKDEFYTVFDQIVREAMAINEEFRCYPDAMAYVIEKRDFQKRKKLVEEKYSNHIDNGAFDSLVSAKLFPYQKEGVCFAAIKGRCIIADDMGLGKTIQAIAACELLRKEMNILSVWIICPTSLKYQWKSEIEKFTGLQSLVIEGNYLKRLEQYKDSSFYKIISYNTAVNDINDINATSPDLFILDEAQRIKNFKTKISSKIKLLTSPFSFVLTGTPLENKLEELYSVTQFADPYVLGPYWEFLANHQIIDEKGKIKGYKDLNKVGQILDDIMIRRRKKDVLLQMPERMDKILYVPMTEEQMAMHNDYKNSVAQIINRWIRQRFLSEKDRHKLMINLNMMRMVCDSTYIIDQESRFDTKIGELMNILDEALDGNEEKVVVFSQWERMTRIVAEELDKRGIGYQYLHGGVPAKDRGKLFDGFNKDADCRVFLSTDAGGVGLNLQAASMLINLDIPWNPAVLEQRIARIYRLGQKRNVSIINMVSTGTIEHRMLGVLNFKKGVSEGILDGGEDTVFMEEGKFKMFMQTVESIMDKPAESIAPQDRSDMEAELPKQIKPEEITRDANPELVKPIKPIEPVETVITGDDDVPSQEISQILNPKEEEVNSAADLMQMGMSFIGKLSKTLADPEATRQLVSSIVKKDEVDGKTYLKIPVENQQVVENVISLFAGLMGGLKKQG